MNSTIVHGESENEVTKGKGWSEFNDVRSSNNPCGREERLLLLRAKMIEEEEIE